MTATCRFDRVYRGNVVLAGDTSGSVAAITGEGLRLSFRRASAPADALEAGELQEREISPAFLVEVTARLGWRLMATKAL
jgi:flavin-dependent dehydrogenase